MANSMVSRSKLQCVTLLALVSLVAGRSVSPTTDGPWDASTTTYRGGTDNDVSTNCPPGTVPSCLPGYYIKVEYKGPCEQYSCERDPVTSPPPPPPPPSTTQRPLIHIDPITSTYSSTPIICPMYSPKTCGPGQGLISRLDENGCWFPDCVDITTTTPLCPPLTPITCGMGRGLFTSLDEIGCPVPQCVTTPPPTTILYCSTYPMVTCGPGTQLRVRYESMCPMYYCDTTTTTYTTPAIDSTTTTPTTTTDQPCPAVVPYRCPQNFKPRRIVLNGCPQQRCIHKSLVKEMERMRRAKRRPIS